MADLTTENRTSDQTFDLVSLLYHALREADVLEGYVRDAADGDDLAGFFREVRQDNLQRAERAKQLLAQHLAA